MPSLIVKVCCGYFKKNVFHLHIIVLMDCHGNVNGVQDEVVNCFLPANG